MTPADADGLFRLLYRSRSALTGSDVAVEAEVAALLEQSALNNARDGVTGALMFTSSMFIQALEGPREVLERTFERVCCDLRHLDVELIEFSPVAERAFGEWSLHRVHGDSSVEALFAHLGDSEAGSVSSIHAAAQAVSLMGTLIRLEPPAGQTHRAA